MSDVARYRKVTHTQRVGRVKLSKIVRKVCLRCLQVYRAKGLPPVAWRLFTCRGGGVGCCEHLCSHKMDRLATCGACLLKRG